MSNFFVVRVGQDAEHAAGDSEAEALVLQTAAEEDGVLPGLAREVREVRVTE